MNFQTIVSSILIKLNLLLMVTDLNINHGTAIAFCATKDLIFIAVDSQINHEKGFKSSRNKIHTLNNTTWVNTGLYKYSDEFNIDEIISTEFGQLSGKENFKSAHLAVRKVVSTKLKDVLPKVELLYPELLKPGIPIICTLIISHTGESFYFERVNYYFEKSKDGNFQITDKVIETNQEISNTLFNTLGSNKSSKPMLDKMLASENPNYFEDVKIPEKPAFKFLSMPEILYYLVYLEVKGNPSEVGAPISVVRVTKDGLKGIIDYPVK